MTNKVALITGAAAGIGAACALRIARDGAAIGVLDLDEARCADTVKAVIAAGGKAVALGADVSKRDQVQRAVKKCREALGPINIVVNNAGVTDFTPFEEVTEALWDRVYRINVLGTFIVTQEVLPDMKAGKWGRIVNISSSSAQTGANSMTTYSSSKGANRHSHPVFGSGVGAARHHGQQRRTRLHHGYHHVGGEPRAFPIPA